MALHRKWINASAALTVVTFAGPILAFAGSAASYKPSSTPPPVKQQFNNAAPPSPPPPPKQKVNNASGTATASGAATTSGAAAQSGKPNTTTSTQTGSKPAVQSLMEAFRAAAGNGAPGNPKIQGGSSQSGSRNLRLDQENVQAPSNQQPSLAARKRQEQQRQQQLEQERLRRQRQLQLQQQQAAKP
jgi:hypothetical protein